MKQGKSRARDTVGKPPPDQARPTDRGCLSNARDTKCFPAIVHVHGVSWPQSPPLDSKTNVSYLEPLYVYCHKLTACPKPVSS